MHEPSSNTLASPYSRASLAGKPSLAAIASLRQFTFMICVLALSSYFPAILSYNRIFYVAIFIAFVFVLSAIKLSSPARQAAWPSARCLLLFLAYLAATALWAQWPGRTLESVSYDLIFLLVWGLFFLLRLVYGEEQIARIFVYVPYLVAGTFIYLLARFGTVRPFDEDSAAQIGATANRCGQWLVVALPFIYWLIRRGHKQRYVELCLALFLVAIAQSRAAYLVVLFIVLAETIHYGKGALLFIAEASKFGGLLLLLLALAWIFPLTRNMVSDGLQRITAVQTEQNTDVDIEREEMLLMGWQAFTEHPLLGYHNLGARVGELFPREIDSHNLFLTLISECGWPGFIIFCFLLSEFFRRTRPPKTNKCPESAGFCTACRISLIAALLTGMAFPMLEFPLFYAVLALGYASCLKRTLPHLPVHAALNPA